MTATLLYPDIDPYRSGWLDRPGGHSLYWEECGNPDGIPVVFLHGGPGAGISPGHRRFFDPKRYRIILFDQRGAGRSRPFGCSRENTTWDLVADMEALRAHLGVVAWLVFGGSWGSTLALAYGQHHPACCLGFVLRGIFLCRDSEIDWFLYGMGRFFPEAYQRFLTAAGLQAPSPDLLACYRARLEDPDPAVHLPAARAWSAYEGSCCTLLPDPALVAGFEDDAVCLALARLEALYFETRGWFRPNQLLEDIGRIADLPAVIVQGRYDVVCPPTSAWALARAWPAARLEMIVDGGHAAMEPGIARALVAATDAFAERLDGS